MAKRTLKKYYLENPSVSGQMSFLDREDLKDLVDEGLKGIKDGIPATVVAQWLISEAPTDLNRKFHTVRQGLLHRAKEIS
ncbi:hypothetical protein OAP09_02615 [Acidimicrobiia bacterium]|nr:hypothetical protein [Acidimicrobiia bacterium]